MRHGNHEINDLVSFQVLENIMVQELQHCNLEETRDFHGTGA